MTFQAQIASGLHRAADRRVEQAPEQKTPAECRTYLKAAVALAALADQFEAGDFDADRMSKFAELIEDEQRFSDLSEAMDDVVAKVGFEPGYLHPDDLIGEALRQAGCA